MEIDFASVQDSGTARQIKRTEGDTLHVKGMSLSGATAFEAVAHTCGCLSVLCCRLYDRSEVHRHNSDGVMGVMGSS